MVDRSVAGSAFGAERSGAAATSNSPGKGILIGGGGGAHTADTVTVPRDGADGAGSGSVSSGFWPRVMGPRAAGPWANVAVGTLCGGGVGALGDGEFPQAGGTYTI